MQDDKKGGIITASLSMAGKFPCDEIWQITASDQIIAGARWVPNLAPSVTLNNKYLYLWKGRPEEEWWQQFADAFKEEMTSREKLGQLRELWNLVSQGKVIALVCECPEDKYCHRRLVADVLARSGIETHEYQPPTVEKIEIVGQPSLF